MIPAARSAAGSLCVGEEAMYQVPDIVYEGDLEVQAGSPMGIFPGLDPLDDEW